MDCPWLKQYPQGVPAQVDPDAYHSLVDLLDEAFERYRARTAYTCMDQDLSFGDIDRASLALGGWLQAHGMKQGDRIAIMLPNVLQYPIAMAAILRIGGIVVNVNPLYTSRELQHQLADSGAKAIIILENFSHTLERVLSETRVEHIIVASIGDMFQFPKDALVNFLLRHVRRMIPHWHLPGHVRFNYALDRGRRMQLTLARPDPGDIAVLQYTGGTTGLSKGACLSHAAIISALLSCEAWLAPALRKRQVAGQLNVACALPLYHAFAFVNCALLAMRFGVHNILIPNPRDIGATIKALRPYKLHMFPAVNTLFNALLNHPDIGQLDFSELLVTIAGGMPAQETVAKRWLSLTGCPVAEGYGLSETCSGVVCNRTDLETFTGTVGLPMPGMQACILDEQGRRLAPGQEGEVALRGPQLMSGYWGRPVDSLNTFTADGWLRTGDIGMMDGNGYLRILDRKKDMIIVSGFNVYPSEVEEVVASHPGVLECAAVGVPDGVSGEAVSLFVVRKDAALTEADIRQHCIDHLTGYKRPRSIHFRDSLPKSNVGKILRRELREALAPAYA